VLIPIRTVEFYIINTNISFLLSLVDINKLKVFLNNITNILITTNSGNILVVRRFGHLFIL
jgi:hypothetical protein